MAQETVEQCQGTRVLRMGMVGGGRDAFIGAVHRDAAAQAGGIHFMAGALSNSAEKALDSGRDLGLTDERNYPSWQEMLAGESARGEADRIDFVSIVTPNDSHYEIASSFVDAGFHVICDKPMVTEIEQAENLVRLVNERETVFCVTYNYTGYPMVKEARDLVSSGRIGEVRKIAVEYHQGWLAKNLESTGQKQAAWRTDPARAGIGGAIGDIGTHAENLVSYVTGLEIDSLCADITSFLGRDVDDDASVLLRFSGGARGTLSASQVCVGELNSLTLRVWGTEGGIRWEQENPNHLVLKSHDGQPDQVFHRGGSGSSAAQQGATRLPCGHPEAFVEAFANIYRAAAAAIHAGGGDSAAFDYPDVRAGARGVRFIHAVVDSSAGGQCWTAPGGTGR